MGTFGFCYAQGRIESVVNQRFIRIWISYFPRGEEFGQTRTKKLPWWVFRRSHGSSGVCSSVHGSVHREIRLQRFSVAHVLFRVNGASNDLFRLRFSFIFSVHVEPRHAVDVCSVKQQCWQACLKRNHCFTSDSTFFHWLPEIKINKDEKSRRFLSWSLQNPLCYIGWFLKRFYLAFLVSSRFPREKRILL